MPSDAVQTIIPPAEQDAIREEVRALMAAERLAMTDIAKLSGLPYGTFSPWMGGTYQGNTSRVADQVRRGLEARRAQARTRALAPKAPAFVVTPTAESITGCLEHAQHMPEWVVVTGGPGIGKTTTAMAYKAANPNVWLLTAEPVHATPRALLDDIAETIGITATGVSSQKLSRAICARLRGTSALLVIDEAQHLTSQTLDQLRSVHDLAGIGIALLGNESIFARLEGGTRAAHYAQLYSRVGMRLARPKPIKADIEALLDAWRVEGEAERRLLHAIARKPGALRGLTKVLRIAHMLAGAEGAERVADKQIRMAWGQYAAGDQLDGADAPKEAA